MSIFPQSYSSIGSAIKTEGNKTPVLLKEYAWDFKEDNFLLDSNGKFIIVTGLEAVKIRNYLSLKIYKGRWFIYRNTVGSKLKDFIGKDKDYIELNIKEVLEDTLLDDYTTGIENITTSLNNFTLTVEFVVITIYGNYKIIESI